MTLIGANAASAVCCTCATPLTKVPCLGENEKPFPQTRPLGCCSRTICGRCIHNNSRFNHYCPYCQISETDNILPPGLKDPPPYAASSSTSKASDPSPPPYTPPIGADGKSWDVVDEKGAPRNEEPVEDVLHFLNHAHDSVNSLSLRYGVPAYAIRRANNISADHLIAGRRTVIIPGKYYKGGVSFSPRPVEGEEEEKRKAKIRRWMVACKVHEYHVALLYLEQAGYDLPLAIDAYFADEEWERTHPARETRRGNGIIGGCSNSIQARLRR
ncbi:hypothetical protein F4802DRAFT_167180 [Xylaria palmicola]|nr:hypothetical protein F4802DRAFT_167180 [Xylaria palmicola]